MSLLFGRQSRAADPATSLIPSRPPLGVGSVTVTPDTSLRMSAVWACLRLRADLISTLPLDVFRKVGDIQVEMPSTPFLDDPAGDGSGRLHWLYASQFELDRQGNFFGIIHDWDGQGNPRVVEPVRNDDVTVLGRGSTITQYRVAGVEHRPEVVWHERQYVVPGIPLGLSPIAYAAMTIGSHMSAQKFATDWFGSQRVPGVDLKNTGRELTEEQADHIAERFQAKMATGRPFVHGKDWELQMISAQGREASFLDSMNASVADVARFLGTPGDMIDAPAESGAQITYANITQRNLQLLVMNLGPAIVRREAALTATTPKPRFVKLNTDAILRMDPQTTTEVLAAQVSARLRTVTEARDKLNLPPLTEEQMAEFDRLFGQSPTPAPAPEGVPA